MPGRGVTCHDHNCGEADCGVAFSLFKHIDIPRVACLNEASEGCCRHVFKPWSERTNFDGPSLQSCEDDPELLLHIPFDGELKVKAITVIGGPAGTSPASVKLFLNRDDLDFGMVQEMQPVQEFTLNEDFAGVLEYPTQVTKFQNVHALDMYFPDNMGADHTQIFFVGIKGEHVERKREAVNAVYEVKPMADANKVQGTEGNAWNMGM